MTVMNLPVEQRFWSKVDKSGDCWIWKAAARTGYGMFSVGGRAGGNVSAHRFAYELSSPIPEGMEIDHICRNRLCVKLSHLRLATRKENAENRAAHRNSKSGIRGVTYRPERNKWRATVMHNGVQHFAGNHDTVEEASEAVRLKRIQLFTYNDEDRS